MKIYVAYDRETEQDIYLEVCAAARSGHGFEVSGCSDGKPLERRWQRNAEDGIAAADQVVVLCAEATCDSEALAGELALARELERPFVLLWSRRTQMCTKPQGATPREMLFSWTPETLLDQLRQNARPEPTVNFPIAKRPPS